MDQKLEAQSSSLPASVKDKSEFLIDSFIYFFLHLQDINLSVSFISGLKMLKGGGKKLV